MRGPHHRERGDCAYEMSERVQACNQLELARAITIRGYRGSAGCWSWWNTRNLQKCEEEASWGSRASSSCGALPDPKHPCDHPQAQTIHWLSPVCWWWRPLFLTHAQVSLASRSTVFRSLLPLGSSPPSLSRSPLLSFKPSSYLTIFNLILSLLAAICYWF